MAESGDIISRIHSSYNQFTRTETKVADYVLNHRREALYMSITELSDACGVGETSIFRFCRSMGLDGYQDFKIRMSLSMSLEDTAQEDLLTSHVLPGDDTPTLIQKVLSNNQKALAETASLVDAQTLDSAVAAMTAARRIFFFGVGASMNSAQKACDKFLRVEPKTQYHHDIHMQAIQASTMTAEDVAVIFSFSGSTKDTNVVARLAHRSGAKVIAITRFQKSPLTEFTDYTLLCAANEGPLQGGSAEADICRSFLTDLLFTQYYHQNIHACREINEKTASAVQNKLY